MFLDFALFILRVVVGLYFVGHGAQKLFGWFGGHGLKGTSGWLASMGLKPAFFWAIVAGLSEFGGGILFALGMLNPLGALGIISAMLMALLKVHWTKGLWMSQGGIEVPLINIAAALAVALAGGGAYSLDALFNIALPEPLTMVGGLVLVVLGVAAGLLSEHVNVPKTKQQSA